MSTEIKKWVISGRSGSNGDSESSRSSRSSRNRRSCWRRGGGQQASCLWQVSKLRAALASAAKVWGLRGKNEQPHPFAPMVCAVGDAGWSSRALLWHRSRGLQELPMDLSLQSSLPLSSASPHLLLTPGPSKSLGHQLGHDQLTSAV